MKTLNDWKEVGWWLAIPLCLACGLFGALLIVAWMRLNGDLVFGALLCYCCGTLWAWIKKFNREHIRGANKTDPTTPS